MPKQQLKGTTLALTFTAASLAAALPALAEPEVSVRGRIHADAAYYDDDSVRLGSGVNVRRARLGMDGKIDDNWSFIIEYDFAENGTSAKDVGLMYKLGAGKVKVGHFKVPMGLNELTSSNNITFIERASDVTAFVDAYRLGVGYDHFDNNVGVQAMLYSRPQGGDAGSGFEDPIGVAGRVVINPVSGDGQVLHLGVSAAYEDLRDYTTDAGAPSGVVTRFRDRPESRVDGTRLVDTGTISSADTTLKAGLELAYLAGPFSAEAEYLRTEVERTAGNEPTFSGYHVQASYVLTGESRGYKKGVFGGVKPAGERGAWEVAARYSVLDLDDSGFTGGEQTNLTLGLNYYANANVRFMLNYIITDVERAAGDDEPNALVARAQVSW